MDATRNNMNEFKVQLKKGEIQKAYRNLMEYIMSLKTYFINNTPDIPVSGGIYHGYMDMTYFALFPEALKKRKLKIAIVFVYDKFRFEVWLSGINKGVQSQYWKLFTENKFNKYSIVQNLEGSDSIVEHVVTENPDFEDKDGLTRLIVMETLQFIKEIERNIL